jgi:multicomponent Na+:H+ antiporter subunit G
MSMVQSALAILLTLGGLTLMLAGSIGLLRLPDFYCRSHAATKVDTLGIIALLAAFAVYEGMTGTAGKLLIAILFIALTNPAPVHALARVALKSGLQPWLNQTGEDTAREGDPEA